MITPLLLIIIVVITPFILFDCLGGKSIRFEPLPVEYLSYINDPEMDVRWEISFHVYDNSQPPRKVVFSVIYNCGICGSEKYGNIGGELYAVGNLADNYREGYSCELPSIQPFLDIVQYIEQHPDIFFDYAEYDVGPSLPMPFSGGEEFFSLRLLYYNIGWKKHYFSITKGIGGDLPKVPEIEHVINMIKDAFMDELLQHPE